MNQSKPFKPTRKLHKEGAPQSGPPAPIVVASLNMTQSFPAPAVSSTLTLGSSTPYLPFLGNRLVLNSFVPNTTAAANVTVGYAVGLRRQQGCSLVEDIGHRHPPGPNTSEVATLPAAQDYLHQLSGLGTKPDVFPQGCDIAVYGLPTNNNVQLLGLTPAGAAIAATAVDGLQIILADPLANKFTTTSILSSSSIQGSFSAADLNDDGKMDIVATFVTDPSTQQLSTAVFLGNGDGTFEPGIYYDVPGDITIDDVTGDGKPDIVVLTNPGVTTLIGKGDGTFTVGSVSATGRTFFGSAGGQVLTGDFNGDGKTDLIADGTVLLGAGDGTFTIGSPVTTDASFNFTSSIPAISVGSLRNNGKLDAVVSQEGFTAIFYGNGDGTFTSGPRYAGLPDFEQVSITDIDGDGNPDIVLGTATGGIYADGGYDIVP
ncbi:MAG: VCBS repeat-containing protein, partial [Acidobacteria bacterium]|nr:VCBS repeat-containing protein [Acidobacteriota bacterium]